MPQTSYNVLRQPVTAWTFPNAWTVYAVHPSQGLSQMFVIPTRIHVKGARAVAMWYAEHSDRYLKLSKYYAEDIEDADAAKFLADVTTWPDEPGYADMKGTADDMLMSVMVKMKGER